MRADYSAGQRRGLSYRRASSPMIRSLTGFPKRDDCPANDHQQTAENDRKRGQRAKRYEVDASIATVKQTSDFRRDLPVVQGSDERDATDDVAEQGRYEEAPNEVLPRRFSDLHEKGAVDRPRDDVRKS